MNKLLYEKATNEDIEMIYQSAKQLIIAYEKNRNLDDIFDWMKNKIEKNISDYIIIYQNNQKVGCFCLIKGIQELELDDFYIIDEYQNMGIGTKVLQELIGQSKQNIYLYVFNDNHRAVHFYEKHGFIKTIDLHDGRSIMSLKKD